MIDKKEMTAPNVSAATDTEQTVNQRCLYIKYGVIQNRH